MIVDVVYEGLSLAKGATAREEGGGTFIELEAPLPVGSRLTVQGPDGPKEARVERVQEGLGGGVLVKFLDAKPAAAKAPAAAKDDDGDDETGGPAEPDKPDEPSEKRGPGRKERRSKSRKTASSS
jgi:hypothetical protein